jgi:large subunit ribosomal protein L27
MAHKKAAGSTQLGRDSQGQRLGVKVADGQKITVGQIIVRQRGTKIHPSTGVRRGKDDTLYAAVDGFVKFVKKQAKNFHGILQRRTYARIQSTR